MGTSTVARFWWLAALAGAAVVPRLPLVRTSFSIDDPAYVTFAGDSPGLVSGVFTAAPFGFYRPLVSLHFEICHALFGDWAPGYHMVSIAVHAVVVWLVFGLCSSLAGNHWPALCGALGFALLPGLNEAIAWTASVGDLWATGFVIGAVLLALAAAEATPGTGRWLWITSLAAVVVGCAAKETAVAAAFLVPAAVWVFAPRRPGWGWIAAYPAVTAVYVAWYASRMPGLSGGGFLVGSPIRCLFNTTKNLVMSLVPIGRNEVGDWLWTSPGLSRALVLGVVVALGCWIWAAVRKRDRLLVFGWLWAVVAFLPVCRFTSAERYTYFPAAGLALVAVAVLARFQDRRGPALTAVVAVVLVVFAIGSALAAVQWAG